MADFDVPPVEDYEAKLELALIEEFLRAGGTNLASVAALPADERARLMHDATAYAANRLAEIEARAHYVHDLHRSE